VYERLIQKLINRNVGAVAGTLRPTGGTTYCTVETGLFSYTYDGSTSTGACFKKNQNCLSEWYWTDPVNVTKFNIRSHYYYPNSSIVVIWCRMNGLWIERWRGTWKPKHAAWDSKAIFCNNCTGIRISQRHAVQPSRPCITEVTVDYEIPPPPEGKASIVSIYKPDKFMPGVEFHIKPKVRNDGGSDTLFMGLTNTDTGEVLKHPDTYTFHTASGGIWEQDWVVKLVQTTNFHGKINVGHVE